MVVCQNWPPLAKTVSLCPAPARGLVTIPCKVPYIPALSPSKLKRVNELRSIKIVPLLTMQHGTQLFTTQWICISLANFLEVTYPGKWYTSSLRCSLPHISILLQEWMAVCQNWLPLSKQCHSTLPQPGVRKQSVSLAKGPSKICQTCQNGIIFPRPRQGSGPIPNIGLKCAHHTSDQYFSFHCTFQVNWNK